MPRNTLTATNILAELLHAMKMDAEAEPLCREVLHASSTPSPPMPCPFDGRLMAPLMAA